MRDGGRRGSRRRLGWLIELTEQRLAIQAQQPAVNAHKATRLKARRQFLQLISF